MDVYPQFSALDTCCRFRHCWPYRNLRKAHLVLLIPRPGTPSSASYRTWIPGSLAPRIIRLPAARSSGMLPLAGSTPPDAPDDLPFAAPTPLRLSLSKNLSRYKQCHVLFESTWHFIGLYCIFSHPVFL